VPAVGRVFHNRAIRAIELLRRRRRLTAFLIAAASVLAMFAFSGFQSSTLLLGDGQLIMNEMEPKFLGDTTSVSSALRLIARTERIAPGATTTYYLSTLALKSAFGADLAAGTRVLNYLLGGLFVLGTLALIIRSSIPAWTALWLIILVFTSGAMQLFFGYVENYTPLFVLCAAYVVMAIRYLHGRCRMWAPVCLAAAAVLFHIEGILLLPSCAFLIALRRNSERQGFVLSIIIAITVIATVAASTLTPLRSFFMPALSSAESYGLTKIGLTGGVAYNYFFSKAIKKYVIHKGFEFLEHDIIPPGDAGISTGQLIGGLFNYLENT